MSKTKDRCVLMYCECRNASTALRQAIHERDREHFNNREEISMNSLWADILDRVVKYVEDLDMTAEELEEDIEHEIDYWTQGREHWGQGVKRWRDDL